jgi:hypothetical protein
MPLLPLLRATMQTNRCSHPLTLHSDTVIAVSILHGAPRGAAVVEPVLNQGHVKAAHITILGTKVGPFKWSTRIRAYPPLSVRDITSEVCHSGGRKTGGLNSVVYGWI